jgi:hypothetical protein
MDRTIPSYRIASEWEIRKWKPFRTLLDKKNKKIFDEMLSIPRFYNVGGSMSCQPVLIRVILMLIIFKHHKKLSALTNEKVLNQMNG